MTDHNELALRAWKDAIGDALTAVKLPRDRTDLSLIEAAELIQQTAHQVGGRFNLRFGPIHVELSPEVRRLEHARLAEHRATRGVRKVRGSKERATRDMAATRWGRRDS